MLITNLRAKSKPRQTQFVSLNQTFRQPNTLAKPWVAVRRGQQRHLINGRRGFAKGSHPWFCHKLSQFLLQVINLTYYKINYLSFSHEPLFFLRHSQPVILTDE